LTDPNQTGIKNRLDQYLRLPRRRQGRQVPTPLSEPEGTGGLYHADDEDIPEEEGEGGRAGAGFVGAYFWECLG